MEESAVKTDLGVRDRRAPERHQGSLPTRQLGRRAKAKRKAAEPVEEEEEEVPESEEVRRRVETGMNAIVPMFNKEPFHKKVLKAEKERVAKIADEILKKERELVLAELARLSENPEADEDKGPGDNFKPFNLTERNVEVTLEVHHRITMPHMEFYEYLEQNEVVEDTLQISHVPYVTDHTNDSELCVNLLKGYPNGVHGYLHNHSYINDILIFQIMAEALKEAENADVFYFTMYSLWLNKFSQKEFSEVFPKYRERFDINMSEDTSVLEPWKRRAIAEAPRAPLKVHGNFISQTIPVPVRNGRQCSENCYQTIDIDEITNKLDVVGDEAEIFVSKSNTLMHYNGNKFMEKLFTAPKVDFCDIAAEVDEFSCMELYLKVLQIAEKPKTADEIEASKKCAKNYPERLTAYQTAIARAQKSLNLKEVPTLVQFSPCAHHFGQCGDDCGCTMICSVDCGCDVNCPKRFPGCACKPGQKCCKIKACACFVQGWECRPETCQPCVDSDSCHNNEFSKGEKMAAVEVGPSSIAGYGLFLKEDVPKGGFIGEYVGEEISEAETERRGTVYDTGINYLFGLPNNSGSIDASRAGNEMRYMNHSRNEAVVAGMRNVLHKRRIAFFANRDLKAGEEITFDYKYNRQTRDRVFNKAPQDRFAVYQNPQEMWSVNPPAAKKRAKRRSEREGSATSTSSEPSPSSSARRSGPSSSRLSTSSSTPRATSSSSSRRATSSSAEPSTSSGRATSSVGPSTSSSSGPSTSTSSGRATSSVGPSTSSSSGRATSSASRPSTSSSSRRATSSSSGPSTSSSSSGPSTSTSSK